jgi:hypothetical protein
MNIIIAYLPDGHQVKPENLRRDLDQLRHRRPCRSLSYTTNAIFRPETKRYTRPKDCMQRVYTLRCVNVRDVSHIEITQALNVAES